MRIYFDTEFTSLDGDADLISAGFVAEKVELYVEITDFRRDACSGFVTTNVLPLLGQGDRPPERMTGMQFGIRFGYWLEQFTGSEIVLVSDHGIDWRLLQEYCGGELRMFPRKIRSEVWIPKPEYKPLLAEARQAFWLANSGMEHRALFDARLLRVLADRQRLEQ